MTAARSLPPVAPDAARPPYATTPTSRWIAGLRWIAEREPVGWFDSTAPVISIRRRLEAHGLIERVPSTPSFAEPVKFRVTGAGRIMLRDGIAPPFQKPDQTRTIIKLTFVATDRYRLCGQGRDGIQYRTRHMIKGHLLEVLDRRGKAFAFATVGAAGRWHLENIAPDQKW